LTRFAKLPPQILLPLGAEVLVFGVPLIAFGDRVEETCCPRPLVTDGLSISPVPGSQFTFLSAILQTVQSTPRTIGSSSAERKG